MTDASCVKHGLRFLVSTVLQQHMFAYSLKVFCLAAYKLFYFLKICHILLAFCSVLWYNKYYMKRSTYYVS